MTESTLAHLAQVSPKSTDKFGMKKNRVIFFVVSLVCGYGAYFFAKETIRITNSNLKVQAVVKDIYRTVSYDAKNHRNNYYYAPVFAYSYGEKDFLEVSSTSSSHPGYNIGEKEFLFIDPENHHRFIIDSFIDKWMPTLLCSLISFVFGLAGVLKNKESMAINSSSTNSPILSQKGKITAEVVAVTQDTSMIINNKVCYVIEAVHKPTGRKFKSDLLTDYPFEYRVGTMVEVVLDPKNPYQGKMLLTNVRKVA